MTFPSLLLGILISTLFGAAFHLWRGGSLGRLVMYLILSWVGFWIGHLLGNQLGWTFSSVGPLRLGMAVLCNAFFLIVGHWLSLVEVKRK